MCQVMVEGDFRPHSSETPQPIFMKLEIYNHFPDMTPHAKFLGYVDVGGLDK